MNTPNIAKIILLTICIIILDILGFSIQGLVNICLLPCFSILSASTLSSIAIRIFAIFCFIFGLSATQLVFGFYTPSSVIYVLYTTLCTTLGLMDGKIMNFLINSNK